MVILLTDFTLYIRLILLVMYFSLNGPSSPLDFDGMLYQQGESYPLLPAHRLHAYNQFYEIYFIPSRNLIVSINF